MGKYFEIVRLRSIEYNSGFNVLDGLGESGFDSLLGWWIGILI